MTDPGLDSVIGPEPVLRLVDQRVEEILADEAPGWFTTKHGRVAHYDTGHGQALCGVGRLVRRALGDHPPCIRCDSMLTSRKATS